MMLLLNAFLLFTTTCQGFNIYPVSFAAGPKLLPNYHSFGRNGLQMNVSNSTTVSETQNEADYNQDCTSVAGGTQKLDYSEIQNIIDVSRPYYKLENEFQVDIPATATNGLTSAMPLGFSCTVDPEMSIGREAGSPISFPEAGRHMAIAGSVVAALNQPPTKNGKHYYLAMDCHLEAASDVTPIMQTFLTSQIPAGMNDLKNDQIIISAVCCELTNRKAVCEIMMQFPKEYGGVEPYYLRVNYTVMAPKVFKRFSPSRALEQQIKRPSSTSNQERKEDNQLVLPQDTLSPYAQFRGLPFDSFEILSQSNSVVIMKTSVPKVSAASCQGHFDGNPALPIAFLAAFCADLSGKAIGTLTETCITFGKECAGPGKKQDTGNILKFISCEVDAHKLVYANTHGLTLSCEVEKVGCAVRVGEPTIFSSNVLIVASAPPGEKEDLIAKMKFKFELVA